MQLYYVWVIFQKNFQFDLISKDFFQKIFHMKKTELYGYVYNCSVDYDNIDVDDILDKIFRLIKQVFIALLSFSGSSATKYVPSNNEPCMARPTVIDLSLAQLNHNPLMITLANCNGSCHNVDDLFTEICVLSKITDVNVKVFNMNI